MKTPGNNFCTYYTPLNIHVPIACRTPVHPPPQSNPHKSDLLALMQIFHTVRISKRVKPAGGSTCPQSLPTHKASILRTLSSTPTPGASPNKGEEALTSLGEDKSGRANKKPRKAPLPPKILKKKAKLRTVQLIRKIKSYRLKKLLKAESHFSKSGISSLKILKMKNGKFEASGKRHLEGLAQVLLSIEKKVTVMSQAAKRSCIAAHSGLQSADCIQAENKQ